MFSLILKLRCDTRFQRAITSCICVFKEITWFEPTNVISMKTQLHAVNACVKRSSQRSLTCDNKLHLKGGFEDPQNA